MILIADNDAVVRSSLSLLLRHAGHDCICASTPDEVLDAVRNIPLHLLIADMNFSNVTSGREGIELLRKVRIFLPDIPVILITAWGTIPLAVEGMQGGAFDFVTKPWDNDRLLASVAAALELSGGATSEEFNRGGIIGDSPAMRSLLDTLARASRTDAPVLLCGERGTGKRLMARTLHANSRRRSSPFVTVEPHRFMPGDKSLAPLLARSAGGTLFIDGIDRLDIAAQTILIERMRGAAFRLVSSATSDPAEAVAAGRFREDLFFMVNLISLNVPPLRERVDDIPPLARAFARPRKLAADAIELLSRLPLPGNAAELRNLIERAILSNDASDRLHASALRPLVAGDAIAETGLEARERHDIEEAFERYGGNRTQMARALGISRQSLYRRMEKYGLKAP